MKQSALEKQLAQKLGISTLGASLIWIALLLHGANIVHNSVLGAHYIVRIGPLALNEIVKVPAGDGFVVSLSFRPGLVLLFVLCTAVGLAWAITIAKYQEDKGSE